ncbi:hypothetical protein EVAR_62306_1 [Eumeta japonica]|uniref:Uncharacterized protein n=1 Tax=Eumeta variegata TaxID=151549 RepID=A0A4C1ZGA9_EUMVA|nr:hypothetical protein EVAR_62306_1 [Eumeta japonica]
MKVTVLPKLQYCRVVSSECCGAAEGAASTYEAVDRHLCSLRVPWLRERRTTRASLAFAPQLPRPPPPTPLLPAPPTPPDGPSIYNNTLQNYTPLPPPPLPPPPPPPPPTPPPPAPSTPTPTAASPLSQVTTSQHECLPVAGPVAHEREGACGSASSLPIWHSWATNNPGQMDRWPVGVSFATM